MQDVVAQTDRFTLRLWREHEAARVLDIYGRHEVVKWLGDGPPTPMPDLAAARAWVRRAAERSLTSPLGVWALTPHATGVPAGSILLVELPNGAGEVEVGWHLHPDSWGHGYATEGARAVLDRGFANGLPEVYATTHLGNAASQAVCARLGMEDLGEMVRWYDVPARVYRSARSA